jgi:1-acyl-sn-glycerol-3-phosphate acyltransferase
MLLKFIGRLLLLFFGWSPIDAKSTDLINSIKNQRKVVIFSHTSYWDFIILFFYRIYQPEHFTDVRILMKPQVFKYGSFILNRIGAIKSSRLEDKGSGTTKRLVNELEQVSHFKFLISPKGTMAKNPWRTSYYYIAKETNAGFAVVGLDYVKKRILLFNIEENFTCIEDTEVKLKTYLKEIVPLYPECEAVKIREHAAWERNVCSLLFIKLSLILILFTFFHK